MKTAAAIAISLLVSLGAGESVASADKPPVVVGVVELDGSAASAKRAEAFGALVAGLRGINSLSVVAVASVSDLLGPTVAADLLGCSDDRCRSAALGMVDAELLVFGSLDETDVGLRARLRAVGTSSSAQTSSPGARVSYDVRTDGIRAAMINAAAELFPDRAARSLGRVLITDLGAGATVWIDGAPMEVTSSEELRLPPGRHDIRIEAPRYAPYKGQFDVRLGDLTEVAPAMSRVRSQWPLVLGSAGLSAALAGVLFRTAATTAADRWREGCAGSCVEGFTRQRYESDRDRASLYEGLAGGLFAVGGALVVSAVAVFFVDPDVTAGGL